MKRLILFIYLSITGVSGISYAQIAPGRQTIDTDLLALRNTVVPDFHHSYDDYLQYAPAGLMVGLKACGYESRSSWGRMLTSSAFSAASMAIIVNAGKYSIGRLRPDGSKYNSFPSGHTATAFMTAALLDKEYGWRSPWFSIGGYTAATVTGVSRMLNNRHWMSDVLTGAIIGIGSVHLGYFISDKIFKTNGISSKYVEPEFYYDSTVKHYVAELFVGRRFILGAEGYKQMNALPYRGSLIGISTDIPIFPGTGITASASASSMIYRNGQTSEMYSTLAGWYGNFHFARILEFQAKAMGGCAYFQNRYGADLSCGVGLSIITDNNFKIKGFANFESISLTDNAPWINTVVAGYSVSWFW